MAKVKPQSILELEQAWRTFLVALRACTKESHSVDVGFHDNSYPGDFHYGCNLDECGASVMLRIQEAEPPPVSTQTWYVKEPKETNKRKKKS